VAKRLTANDVFLRSITESELQKNIIELAELRGWAVVHINDSRAQRATGFPDLLMIRRPRIVWAELKREANAGHNKNDPTEMQRWWMEELEACEAEVYLWRPNDWMESTIDKILK